MTMLLLFNGPANRGSQFGSLGQIATKLVRLIAVGQGLLKPVRGQVIAPPLGKGSGQSPNEFLPALMLPDVFGPDQLESFVQPTVGQRTLSLFYSQNQHR
jgi:hypothetical protein